MGKLRLFVVVLFLWSPCYAATYYVANTGSNSDNGSITAPWLTLQWAHDRMNAGDTVYLRGGIYDGLVVQDKNGNESNYYTIQGYPGESAIIEGCSGVPGWSLYNDGNSSHYIYTASWSSSYLRPAWDNASLTGSIGFVDIDRIVDEDHWLEPRFSLATMNKGSWYYDTNGTMGHNLYVWLADDGNASQHNIYTVITYNAAHPVTFIRSSYWRIKDVIVRLAAVGISTYYGHESSYIDIDNVTIYGAHTGITIEPPSHHVTITNSTIYSVEEAGIQLNGTYSTINNNIIYNTGFISWNRWASPGVILVGGHNTVSESEIYNTKYAGILCETWGSGTQYYEADSSHDNIIYVNYIHDASGGTGPGILFSGSDNCTAYSNVIKSMVVGVAADIGGSGGSPTPDQRIAKNNQILNNTIINCSANGIVLNGNSASSLGTIIKNNIFSSNTFEWYTPNTDYISDYNLFNIGSGNQFRYGANNYTSVSSYQLASSQDPHSLSGDPLFAETALYTILGTSPAVSGGTNLGTSYTDYSGNSLPTPYGWPIGAQGFNAFGRVTGGMGGSMR